MATHTDQFALVGKITDDPEQCHTQVTRRSQTSASQSATRSKHDGQWQALPPVSSAARRCARLRRKRAVASVLSRALDELAGDEHQALLRIRQQASDRRHPGNHVGPDLQFTTAKVANSTADVPGDCSGWRVAPSRDGQGKRGFGRARRPLLRARLAESPGRYTRARRRSRKAF